ncbi:hypothetical protein AB6802_18975 [Mesorhizobium sp. RCC_202]|uniref:hypothetical protein n=1 Tax=Mesorhizobium sp. RCC_202 TaxID=3239222 RepID=UPI0035255AF1
MPDISISRLKAGMRQRIIVLEALLKSRTKRVVQRKRNSISLTALHPPIQTAENDFFAREFSYLERYLTFSHTYRSYSLKASFSEILQGQKTYHIFRNLAVGDVFDYYSESNEDSLSPSDYSLFRRIYQTPLPDEAITRLRTCMIDLFRRHKLPFATSSQVISSYLHIIHLAKNLDKVENIDLRKNDPITALRRSLQIIVRSLWPITGGFVPHTLMRLCDPEDNIEYTNDSVLRSEATILLLDKTLASILLIRRLNGYRNINHLPLVPLAKELFSSKSSIYKKVDCFSKEEWRQARAIRVSGSDPYARIVSHTINIYCDINTRRERESIYREIEAIHGIDPLAAKFLNWGRIADYMRQFPAEITPRSIFISILMTDIAIARRFPLKVGLAHGNGRPNNQIFELASDLLKRGAARRISGFLRRFLEVKVGRGASSSRTFPKEAYPIDYIQYFT